MALLRRRQQQYKGRLGRISRNVGQSAVAHGLGSGRWYINIALHDYFAFPIWLLKRFLVVLLLLSLTPAGYGRVRYGLTMSKPKLFED